jgi:hypothetical protein
VEQCGGRGGVRYSAERWALGSASGLEDGDATHRGGGACQTCDVVGVRSPPASSQYRWSLFSGNRSPV